MTPVKALRHTLLYVVHTLGVLLWAGSIPPELGGLTALKRLALASNLLSGE